LYFDWNYINWITVAEVTKWINEKYLYNTESFLTKEWSLNSRIIKVNTLLLSNSWATLWVPKITKIKWCINDGSVAFLDLKNIDINFLFYYFSQLTKELRDIVQGSWQPNLNTELVKDLKIWLSSLEEQQEIVDFLDKETVKIDSHIKKVERRIDLYEEYKKSIIYNVVTGKVEV
jgi:type I restriction enzyme S subunit